jgi:hypothetical protein
MPSFKIRAWMTLLLLVPAGLRAQEEKLSDRMFYGGYFGLQFGTYTYVEISPLVGYRLTDKLSTGVGAKYIYYSVDDKSYVPAYHYSTNIYGGSVFLRYLIVENFFAHAEFELINLEAYDGYYAVGRRNVPDLFLGGGYRMPMGSNSSFSIMALWEVIEDRYSPYVSPILRIGFGFGF